MDSELLKRYSLTEIVLLVVFMLGLGLAQIIVKMRHRVTLSDPIELLGSGLSICMPINPGWEFEKSWRYESDNNMAIVAQRQTLQTREASIHWRYSLCSPGGSARDILQYRAGQTGSVLGPIATISHPVSMEYAVVYPSGSSVRPFYMGIACLDFGRYLELQVHPNQVDFLYVERIFHTLVSGIRYEPSERLRYGKELTTRFWESLKTQPDFLDERAEQAFLIKNTENRPVGYHYCRYSTMRSNQQTQLQISSQQYEHNLSLLESVFRYNDDPVRFTWKTTFQRIGMGNPRTYSVVNEPDGMMTISSNFEKDKQYACDSPLPELFLPHCAAKLLDSEQTGAIVDVLAPDGSIVPTVLEKIEIEQAIAHSEQIVFAIRVDFLNHPKSFEELYFDANRRLMGRFEQQPQQQRLWDLTTSDELRRIFGNNFQPSNNTVAAIR